MLVTCSNAELFLLDNNLVQSAFPSIALPSPSAQMLSVYFMPFPSLAHSFTLNMEATIIEQIHFTVILLSENHWIFGVSITRYSHFNVPL
jgi:hypothetical protein